MKINLFAHYYLRTLDCHFNFQCYFSYLQGLLKINQPWILAKIFQILMVQLLLQQYAHHHLQYFLNFLFFLALLILFILIFTHLVISLDPILVFTCFEFSRQLLLDLHLVSLFFINIFYF